MQTEVLPSTLSLTSDTSERVEYLKQVCAEWYARFYNKPVRMRYGERCLPLAHIVWFCRPCKKYLFYPTVLQHPCVCSLESMKANLDLAPDVKINRALELVQNIVGRDQVAKTENLDTLPTRLTCRKCRSDEHFKQVAQGAQRMFDAPMIYTWRAAIIHDFVKHNSTYLPEWHRVKPDLEPFIHEFERTTASVWAQRQIETEERQQAAITGYVDPNIRETYSVPAPSPIMLIYEPHSPKELPDWHPVKARLRDGMATFLPDDLREKLSWETGRFSWRS